MREVVGEFELLSVPFVHSCVSDTPLFHSHGTIATMVYVFATEARGLTVIVELRRYNRSKKLQNFVVISGFVVRRVVISDFFACIVIAGQTFGQFRRYIRFVVITDVVINDFYCILVRVHVTPRNS